MLSVDLGHRHAPVRSVEVHGVLAQEGHAQNDQRTRRCALIHRGEHWDTPDANFIVTNRGIEVAVLDLAIALAVRLVHARRRDVHVHLAHVHSRGEDEVHTANPQLKVGQRVVVGPRALLLVLQRQEAVGLGAAHLDGGVEAMDHALGERQQGGARVDDRGALGMLGALGR